MRITVPVAGYPEARHFSALLDQAGAKIFEPGKGVNLVFAEYRLLALINRRYPVSMIGYIEVTVFVVLLLEKIWQHFQGGKNLTGASLV
ncbi:MAG: hypothetical protein PHD82_15910 [Candidatus Riflebacteria bacterium]|nr:hypothetical protein [Candidatus Riflebacteria bacterium]